MDVPSEQAVSLALICRVDILPLRSLSGDQWKKSMVWNLHDAGCSSFTLVLTYYFANKAAS